MTFSAIQPALLATLTALYDPGESRAICRIILEDAFQGKNRQATSPLSPSETIYLEEILRRLAHGEPVQYILGAADFFGLKFIVTPDVLIPRQETEDLVAWIIDDLKQSEQTSATILDVGLGSGCIGITLKKHLPQIELYGVEKSEAALNVARQNADRILNRGQVHFRQADALESDTWHNFPPLDIVVSNPPYIPEQERSLVPAHVERFEPAIALFVANEDPLLFYRVIGQQAFQKLKAGGAIYFECNEFNAIEVLNLLQTIGFNDITLKKDLSGADRMVKGVKA